MCVTSSLDSSPAEDSTRYPKHIIQSKAASPLGLAGITSPTYFKRLRNAIMPFTQNSAPLRDDSPSVPSYKISSAVESQTAVEDPPARFAILPQDAIKSDCVTFPSFEEYEESAVPERPEMPKEPEGTIKTRPYPFCFANFLSRYHRQKKEKAIEGPPRSPSYGTKVLSLFSSRSKRKAIQEPAPSPSCFRAFFLKIFLNTV